MRSTSFPPSFQLMFTQPIMLTETPLNQRKSQLTEPSQWDPLPRWAFNFMFTPVMLTETSLNHLLMSGGDEEGEENLLTFMTLHPNGISCGLSWSRNPHSALSQGFSPYYFFSLSQNYSGYVSETNSHHLHTVENVNPAFLGYPGPWIFYSAISVSPGFSPYYLFSSQKLCENIFFSRMCGLIVKTISPCSHGDSK